MGNKMCKKKTDVVDNHSKGPSPFDRIFSRLNLKPKSWKSDSQLDRKKVNRYEVTPKETKNGLITAQPHSKSTDWTEVHLEVPEKEKAIHLKNPQLSFIFNDNSTPTPPPRKHKKTLREKIETVAKNSFNALQSKKLDNEEKPLAEEVICVKKVIKYGCPACEGRENCIHKTIERSPSEKEKRKSLSMVSLPTYNDMKLSLTHPGDDLKFIDSSVTNSANSLPNNEHKRHSATSGKFENYMTRCRSFGSLLNSKLKTPKKQSGNESDDSFGGLEDWDLGILEHYNPKDASLPRPRKPAADHVLSDIEQLIIPNEEIQTPASTPIRPLRRSESLIKKINEEIAEAAIEKDHNILVEATQVPVEHSSLMRILREFSIEKTQLSQINEDFINAEKVAAS